MEMTLVQAEAILKMAERNLKRKKCRPEAVEEAREQYNRVKATLAVDGRKVKGALRQAQGPVLELDKGDNETKPRQLVDLLNRANDLKKEMAGLSNQLEVVDDEQALQILARLKVLNTEKENTWTKYRYYERNGVLPEHELGDSVVAEKTPELLQLEALKASEMQKRSKARKRLADERIKPETRIKYEEKVGACDAEIEKLNERIKVLKHGY